MAYSDLLDLKRHVLDLGMLMMASERSPNLRATPKTLNIAIFGQQFSDMVGINKPIMKLRDSLAA